MCFGGNHETVKLSGMAKPTQLKLGKDQFILNSFEGFDDGDLDEENFDDIHELELELKRARDELEKVKLTKDEEFTRLKRTEQKLDNVAKQDLIRMIHAELERSVLIDELLEYEKLSKRHMDDA